MLDKPNDIHFCITYARNDYHFAIYQCIFRILIFFLSIIESWRFWEGCKCLDYQVKNEYDDRSVAVRQAPSQAKIPKTRRQLNFNDVSGIFGPELVPNPIPK